MRILALSDIHGAVDRLESILAKEDEHDLVLVAGDITDTSLDDYAGTAQTVIELLDSQGRFVKAVPGNMDDESVLKLLIENRINLHKNIFSLQDHEFIGFGGSMKSEISLDVSSSSEDDDRETSSGDVSTANASSSPSGRTPFDTPFEPEDSERGHVVQQLLQRTKADNRCIVSHEPPHRTTADRTGDGEHVGSESLRGIIEDEDIGLVLCGHIHESRTVDELAGTTIVNPGPVKEGEYAVLEVEDGVEAELRG